MTIPMPEAMQPDELRAFLDSLTPAERLGASVTGAIQAAQAETDTARKAQYSLGRELLLAKAHLGALLALMEAHPEWQPTFAGDHYTLERAKAWLADNTEVPR